MAWDKTKNACDAANCAEHAWPRGNPGGVLRSYGMTEYQHCNNCLAMRIYFWTDVLVNGVWTRVDNEKIVEPDFEVAKKNKP